MQQQLDKHNQVRVNDGKAPLQLDSRLLTIAMQQAINMNDLDRLSRDAKRFPDLETRASRLNLQSTWLGENLAYSTGPCSVDSVFAIWWDSSSDRSIMLDSRASKVGFAAIYNPVQNKCWWSAVFAQVADVIAPVDTQWPLGSIDQNGISMLLSLFFFSHNRSKSNS